MTKKTLKKHVIQPETAAQKFHKELESLKKDLPKDWRIQLFQLLPDYDSYRGGLLLKNVWAGKSTDTAILEGLKQIVKKSIKK